METNQFATALKRLEEMAAEYRNLFELDLLRYQLLKPQHNEASKQALRKVLSHTKFTSGIHCLFEQHIDHSLLERSRNVRDWKGGTSLFQFAHFVED